MLLWASWSSSFMSSAFYFIYFISFASYNHFHHHHDFHLSWIVDIISICLIMSCDSLVNNPFSKAYWIYGLCVLSSSPVLIPSQWRDNGPTGSVTSCNSCWGAIWFHNSFAASFHSFCPSFFCFPFILFLLPSFSCWLGILHLKQPGAFFFQFPKVGRVMIF